MALAGMSVPAGGQARPGLSGVVLDALSERPLAGVVLTLSELHLVSQTDDDGTFAFPELRGGEYTLRVGLDRYASSVEQVSIAENEAIFMQVALAPVAVALAELLAVVDGPSQGIRPESGDPRTAADLLQSSVPGLNLRRNMGSASGGARVQLRGVNSLALSNEPTLYLDGIRISSRAGEVHTLETIPASSVKRIRIIRGPSAQYPEASNGAILIETSQSGAGSPGS
jgi:hypothetical protein